MALRRLKSAAFVIVFVVSCLPAQEPINYAVLSEPDSLYLVNGRGITGDARNVVEGRLVFAGTSATGSVEYSFAQEEVARLDFSGHALVARANELYAGERYAEAVVIMEALYKQRARFFAFLQQDQVAWFQRLADGAYMAGDYYLAVGVARNVRPFIRDARIQRELHDRELLAHYHLPLLGKTQELAESWVRNWEPYGESALGWYILGQLAFDREDADAALWFCLRPIVFSSQYQTDYLPNCYALAIVAAVAMEDFNQAEMLLTEMKDRGLSWPVEPKFAPYRAYFDEGIPKPEDQAG